MSSDSIRPNLVRMLTQTMSGEALRKAREQRGLSGRDLAARLGVRDDTVYRYERGDRQPSARTFIRICAVLEINSDDLLLDTEKES